MLSNNMKYQIVNFPEVVLYGYAEEIKSHHAYSVIWEIFCRNLLYCENISHLDISYGITYTEHRNEIYIACTNKSIFKNSISKFKEIIINNSKMAKFSHVGNINLITETYKSIFEIFKNNTEISFNNKSSIKSIEIYDEMFNPYSESSICYILIPLL